MSTNLFTTKRTTDNNLSEHQTTQHATHNRLQHGTNKRGSKSNGRQQKRGRVLQPVYRRKKDRQQPTLAPNNKHAPHNRLEHGTNRRGGESSARQQQEGGSANLFTAERMADVSHFRSSDRCSRRLECCCSIDEGLREDAGTFPCPKRLYSARYEDVQPVKRK